MPADTETRFGANPPAGVTCGTHRRPGIWEIPGRRPTLSSQGNRDRVNTNHPRPPPRRPHVRLCQPPLALSTLSPAAVRLAEPTAGAPSGVGQIPATAASSAQLCPSPPLPAARRIRATEPAGSRTAGSARPREVSGRESRAPRYWRYTVRQEDREAVHAGGGPGPLPVGGQTPG